MPELPEVETIRRGLHPLIRGRVVTGVEVRERRLREPVVQRAMARLRGATFTGVRRRGKYLLLDTDAGLTLLVHLGMSGRLWVSDADRPRRAHEHIVISLGDARQLRFVDPRRFGLMKVLRSDRLDLHPRLRGLGPEPFDPALTGDSLYGVTRNRRVPVKNFLMNSRAIAGIGNIYACETLFRAELNPRRQVRRIGRTAWGRLTIVLRAVLGESIRAGGTTLRDFYNAEDEAGYFAADLRVYDREGAPCGRCGSTIRKMVQGGRSTFYCARCQR